MIQVWIPKNAGNIDLDLIRLIEPDTSDGPSRNRLKDIENATKDEVEIIREHPASLVFRLTTKNRPLDKQHLTTPEVVKSTSDTFRLTTKIVNLAHNDFLDHIHVETSNFYNSSVNQNKKKNPIKMQTTQRLSTTATTTTPFLTTKDQVAVSLSILNLKASRKPQRTKGNHLRSHLKKSVKRDGQGNDREQTNQNELEKEDDNIDFEILANEPDRMRHKIRKFFKANETDNQIKYLNITKLDNL